MVNGRYFFDAHAHIGLSSLSGNNNSEEYLLNQMKKNGVDGSLVLPHAKQDLASVVEVHDRIGEFMKKYPGRILGMTSLNPRLGEETYYKETKRCVDTYGFRGIKLEPQVHALHVHSQAAEIVFACAREFDIPVMIHTGSGTFSTPVFIPEVLKKFPEVKVIMAHSGMITYFSEALMVAKQCENVLFETSWSTVTNVLSMVETVGSERIMLGSDHPLNIPVELAKVMALELKPEDQRNILGETARKIYKL